MKDLQKYSVPALGYLTVIVNQGYFVTDVYSYQVGDWWQPPKMDLSISSLMSRWVYWSYLTRTRMTESIHQWKTKDSGKAPPGNLLQKEQIQMGLRTLLLKLKRKPPEWVKCKSHSCLMNKPCPLERDMATRRSATGWQATTRQRGDL